MSDRTTIQERYDQAFKDNCVEELCYGLDAEIRRLQAERQRWVDALKTLENEWRRDGTGLEQGEAAYLVNEANADELAALRKRLGEK